MLTDILRKKVSVIIKYCRTVFTEAEWYDLGTLTGYLEMISNHDRLLRSYNFGDDDYDYCVAEVINEICDENPQVISQIIDHFDIDLWYQSEEPTKYERVFGLNQVIDVKFWSENNLRIFISHLSANRKQIGHFSKNLKSWGVETFVAHDDIEPTLEWLKEIEKALITMDVLLAVLEPGFKESNWCDQEVGFALGRNVEVIPLRNGIDPYGILGKLQGLAIKGKYPNDISEEVIRLLLKKQKVSQKIINNLPKSLNSIQTEEKVNRIKKLYEWNVMDNNYFKSLLETINLNDSEKEHLKKIIKEVGAFTVKIEESFENDIPF